MHDKKKNTCHKKGDLREVALPKIKKWTPPEGRLWNMINYTIGRHDYHEKQRGDLNRIGIGLVSIAGALSTLILGILPTPTSDPARQALLAGLLVLAITGVAIVFYYVHSTSPNYPFRKVADIRSWYFIYNLPKDHPSSLSRDPDEAAAQIQQVLDSYQATVNRIVELTDPVDWRAEDLEQVFILQMLQSQKRKSVKTMQRILQFGITTSLAFTILIWICHIQQ